MARLPYPHPPRSAERLLAWFLERHPASAFVIGDLREEFASRASRNPWLGVLWYWAQALATGARLRFGSSRLVPHARLTPTSFGDQMRSELSLALRSLTRRPVVSSAIVLTIAGAIAATAIAFTVVRGVLLRPLPYQNAGDLVTIWERPTTRDVVRNPTSPMHSNSATLPETLLS